MKLVKAFFLIIFLSAFAFGFFALGFFSGKSYYNLPLPDVPAIQQQNKSENLLNEIMKKVQNNYFEKVSSKKLIDSAAKGMLSSLNDPYAAYLPPREHKAFQEMVNGSFFGVGILIAERKGEIEVISPIPGTPAYKAGVQPNDAIVKIDSRLTKGMRLTDVVNLIKGPKDTLVTLTMRRAGEKKLLVFPIRRDEIHIPNLVEKKIGKDIGYIALANFDGKTDRSLKKSVNKLIKTGAKGLILDLRNNGGGLLDEAVGVSSVFIQNGTIVSLVERGGSVKVLGAKGGANEKIPLVVLINKGSASASEIVAGAIKDRKRGILVGERSFGKGSVQTDFSLSNGGGLKITTAKYLTPSGLSIDKIGIAPNVVVKSGKAIGHGFGGAFMKFKDDVQLRKAEQVLRQQMR